MIRQERFFGGAYYEAIASNLVLKPCDAKVRRVLCLDPQSSDLHVELPDARDLLLGFPLFVIVNLSSTYNLGVRESGEGSNAGNILTEYYCILSLYANSTQAGTWKYKIGPINTGSTLQKV